MHPALKSYLKRFLIVAAGAAVLACGTFVVTVENHSEALRKLAMENDKVIKRQQRELDEAHRKIAQLEALQVATKGRCSSEADRLKTSLDAFAKQAGACETLRQKLHVQGYTS